jgi:surfeit locus 1 family protein
MQLAQYQFKPSLIPSVAFVLIFPVLLGLGFWQLDRAEQKQQILSERSERGGDDALDLGDMRPLGAGDRYRAAHVSGRYLEGRHWLLDNRMRAGRAGYHVFTLFALDEPPDGRAVLVNRGWLPVGPSREFLPTVTTPEGRLSLRGRLDLPASVGIELDVGDLTGLAPVMVVQHLDLEELAAATGAELLPYALVLDEGEAGVFDRDWSRAPGITPEKHLGYAVQWFALALALLIIYVGVNTRRAGVSNHDE